jgi:hypothetical protein
MERAKQLVHEALKQYPAAIPWFIGIYDDWTIGHLRRNMLTDKIELHSENFSDENFQSMCQFLSKKINQEVHPDFLFEYAGYNGEIGRFVVKQFVQAITDLMTSNSSRLTPEIIGKAYIDTDNNEYLPAAKDSIAGLLPGQKASSVSPKVRVAVLQRDGFRCVFCGRTSQQTQLEIDCKLPLGERRSNDISNFQSLCIDCYQGKEDFD